MALVRKEVTSDVAAIDAVTVAAFHAAAHTSHTEHFIIAPCAKPGNWPFRSSQMKMAG